MMILCSERQFSSMGLFGVQAESVSQLAFKRRRKHQSGKKERPFFERKVSTRFNEVESKRSTS